jgi:hypothetical protein
LTRRRRSLEIVEEGVEMTTGDIENPSSPKNSVNTMDEWKDREKKTWQKKRHGCKAWLWNVGILNYKL